MTVALLFAFCLSAFSTAFLWGRMETKEDALNTATFEARQLRETVEKIYAYINQEIADITRQEATND